MPDSPPIRVRFAPAPTGYLHLGGARTALFNWLYARGRGGVFVLRIEDTDLGRSTEESSRQVLDALRWLGLDWDEGPEVGGARGPYYQSQRRDLHMEHIRRLVEAGKAYECYMTPEELEARRNEAIAAGRPFRYEGWHRALTRAQTDAFRAEGRRPAIRLRVDAPEAGFTVHDLIKGPTHFPAEQIDDFVLARSDGAPSFHLANVVDDATMGITHVIRGEDHLTNTIRHQVLFEMLGYPAPRYGHVPMILGPDRSKLSKRHGAVSVLDYRDQGYLPDAMLNELALLGWSAADGKEDLSREELIARFDLDRCGRSASIFDFAKLDHFNKVRLQAMTLEELTRAVEPFLNAEPAEVIAPEIAPEKLPGLVELVRDELVRLTDIRESAARILAAPVYAAEVLNDEALAETGRVLPAFADKLRAAPEPWERADIKKRLGDAGKELGVKGKGLFMPVRAALTGTLHGPALDGVVVVLGKEEALRRLDAGLAAWSAAKIG